MQNVGYPCPKCGHADWKKEKVHQEIKVCRHCGHSPFVDRQIEMEGRGKFEDWLKEVVTKHETAKTAMAEADKVAQEKGIGKLSVAETATLRRAARELSEAQTVLDIALQVQKLLELPFAEGAVTIHIPELGLFTQFSWGNYDLLASLKKTLSK